MTDLEYERLYARLNDEYEDLRVKLVKAMDARDTKKFNYHDYALLEEQIALMKAYLYVLSARKNRIKRRISKATESIHVCDLCKSVLTVS